MTSGLSLNAAGADAFYYPPEWDPSQGNLDSFQRKRGFEHHLGKSRVKRLHEGILVVRFEVPFHIRCEKCDERIAKGERFNAEKKANGKYHTSTIWEFTMYCKKPSKGKTLSSFCDGKLVFRADPQLGDYIPVEGWSKCIDTSDAANASADGRIELLDVDTRRKMALDPMLRLEHAEAGEVKKKKKADFLGDLKHLQGTRWDEDYGANRILRDRFRAKKREELAREAEERKIKNFAMPLLDAGEEDLQEARKQKFRTDHEEVRRAMKRASSSIFPNSKNPKAELLAKRQKVAMAKRMEIFGKK